MVYPRRTRRSAFCVELISFLLRSVAICIGTINVWLVISDKQRMLSTRGYEGISDSGYDVVMITNLFLIVGSVLDWYILVAFWILIYAFIIIYCSAKFVITGVFPWTPGISYTASVVILDKMEFSSGGLRPMVAIMYTLANFLMVFLVFLVTAVLDFKKSLDVAAAASGRGAGSDGLPLAFARMAGGGRGENHSHSSSPPTTISGMNNNGNSNSNNNNSCDGLPTYSELSSGGGDDNKTISSSTATTSSSTVPPPYSVIVTGGRDGLKPSCPCLNKTATGT